MTVFIAAVLGSLGFGLMFGNRGLKLVFSALGGAVCWGAYLLFGLLTDVLFLQVVGASVCAAVFSELCARLLRAPATVFTLVAAMPLIPGGLLYRTMDGALSGNSALFLASAGETLICAAGIAVGIVAVSLIFKYVSRLSQLIRQKKQSLSRS